MSRTNIVAQTVLQKGALCWGLDPVTLNQDVMEVARTVLGMVRQAFFESGKPSRRLDNVPGRPLFGGGRSNDGRPPIILLSYADKGTRPGRNRCQPCPAISCQGWAGCV